MLGIRKTLQIGATVFGFSALLLIVLPEVFIELLGLASGQPPLVWSMRMIGITLVALAGNMWLGSRHRDDLITRRYGWLMTVCATALGVLTLLLPAELTWFAWLYAFVGFAFGANYLVCLLRKLY